MFINIFVFIYLTIFCEHSSSRLTIISLEFKVSLNTLTFEHLSSRLIQYFLEGGITCNVLAQVKDLQVKLDEAEQQAMKGGRKVRMLTIM